MPTFNGEEITDPIALQLFAWVDALDRENQALRRENAALAAAQPAGPSDAWTDAIDRQRTYDLMDRREIRNASLDHARKVETAVVAPFETMFIVRNAQGLIEKIVKERPTPVAP